MQDFKILIASVVLLIARKQNDAKKLNDHNK